MSNQSPSFADAQRREAAAQWLVRLEQPEASETDWIAFEAWLADLENRQALNAIETALERIEDQREAIRRHLAAAPKGPRISPARHLGAGLFIGLAAAAVLAIVVELRPPSAQEVTYAAPADAIRVVALPDASNITLNRGAIVHMRWSAQERHVELLTGEAAFEVVRNASAPFTVVSGAEVVRDVGTEFDVLREHGALTVTVRSGSVSVLTGSGVTPLAPGDQARFEAGRITTRRVNPGDAFAWRQGRLIYRDARLSEVVADLNRYSATRIEIGDANAGTLRFSGVLSIDSPTAMTARLEAFLPVHSEQNAGEIVLRSR